MNKFIVTKNKQTRGIQIICIDTKMVKKVTIDSKDISKLKDRNFIMDPIPTIEKDGILYLNI